MTDIDQIDGISCPCVFPITPPCRHFRTCRLTIYSTFNPSRRLWSYHNLFQRVEFIDGCPSGGKTDLTVNRHLWLSCSCARNFFLLCLLLCVWQIFLDVPLQEVQRRDPKGLYKQVEEGKIKSFTGVSEDAPYEAPLNAGEGFTST